MEECKTMHRYADAYIVNVYPNGGNARDAMLSRFFFRYVDAYCYAVKTSEKNANSIVLIEEIDLDLESMSAPDYARQQEFIGGRIFRDGEKILDIVTPTIRVGKRVRAYEREEYTAEEIEAIIVGIKEGFTIRAIARAINRDSGSLSRFVNDSALKEKTENAHPAADKEEILKYLKKYPTASNKELLDKFHTSTKVLSKLRKQINK